MLRRELVGIQHLRGIAAILVVWDHIEGMCQFTKYFGSSVAGGFFLSGYVGVELFFVISGFIMPYVTLTENTLVSKVTVGDFLQRRFIRIIPFMWVCIIGYASLKIVGRGSISILPYLRAMMLFPIDSVEPNQIWTLRHEALFYCLLCLFLILYRYTWPLLVVWFISPFIWFNIPITHTSTLGLWGDFLFNKVNILFGMGFIIGIACQKNLSHFTYTIKTRISFLIFAGLAILLLFLTNKLEASPGVLSFKQVFVLGGFSTLMVTLAVLIDVKKPLNFWDRFGVLLGDASYSIYLTHPAIISAMLGIWSKHQPSANLIVVFTTISLTCILVGISVHLWIEKPLIAKVKQLLFKPSVLAPLAKR